MPCGFCISLVTYGSDAGGNTDSSVMTGGDAKSLLQMTTAGWAREEWGHQRKAKVATAGVVVCLKCPDEWIVASHFADIYLQKAISVPGLGHQQWTGRMRSVTSWGLTTGRGKWPLLCFQCSDLLQASELLKNQKHTSRRAREEAVL